MSFEPFSADMEIISKLPDNPSGTGITPADLKAAFDLAGVLLKDYINNVLYPEIGKSVDVDAAITAYLDNTLTAAGKPAGAKATGDAIRGLFTSAVHGGDYVLNSGESFACTQSGVRTLRIGSGEAVMLGNLVQMEAGNVELTAAASGLKRNNLVVLRWKRENDTVSVSFAAIAGVETSGTPVDPSLTNGDINTGGTVTRELPLYRAVFNGTALESVVPMFYPERVGSILEYQNVSVPVSAWITDTNTDLGFTHRAAVALTGVTANMVPDVYFWPSDAVSGNFSPATQSYDGGVYIYAASKPTAAMTIPTIRVTK